MEKCGHYEKWRVDFDCVEQPGIRFLRYGPALHRTFLGAGNYDWSFADETFPELRARGIMPIVDLCHFGVPDWLRIRRHRRANEVYSIPAASAEEAK